MGHLSIGFANKFYTLWEISTEIRHINEGHSYEITNYRYIKNISFDKEVALAKYPNVPFDEDLKGKTQSWNSTKEIWDNVNVFRFGQWKYYNIDTFSDTSYIEWYWDNCCGEDHKKHVGEVLESRGYEIRTKEWISKDGYKNTHVWLMTPEDLKEERIQKEKVENTIKSLETKEPIEIMFDRNPNCDGEEFVDYVKYHFPEVKEYVYDRFPYYLPVLKGKAKRIKNKNLRITNYTFEENDGTITVEILDFEIIK